ncbi:hypothetical protein BH11MYX3_BH11MYX3_10320 [soil metagenome]
MSELLTIEPDGQATHGACPDCGSMTRSVWGYVSNERGARAAYVVRWTDGHLERGAQLMVSIGTWGSESIPDDRMAFGLECRIIENGPAFMLVDAEELPWGDKAFLGQKLTRAAALASPLKDDVFAITDRLIEDDPRFRAFLSIAT